MKSAGKRDMVRDAIRDRGDDRTHAVHGIGKCLGILQKTRRGGFEDGKVTLIVVELWISGLWRWGRIEGKESSETKSAHSWTCRPWRSPCAVSYETRLSIRDNREMDME